MALFPQLEETLMPKDYSKRHVQFPVQLYYALNPVHLWIFWKFSEKKNIGIKKMIKKKYGNFQVKIEIMTVTNTQPTR